MVDASGSIHTYDFGALKDMIIKVTSQFVLSSAGKFLQLCDQNILINKEVNK